MGGVFASRAGFLGALGANEDGTVCFGDAAEEDVAAVVGAVGCIWGCGLPDVDFVLPR